MSIIFNKSLSTGKYPSNFKKCIVIPLFKAGNKLECGNYRPISISLTLSNIFEKCIKNRLLDFLNTKCFFSKCQFGFRPGLSTIDALFKVDNFVRNNIDHNNKVMGVFLDVQKAFDSVNHKLLMFKLENAGIRGLPYNLIKSFLGDRTQRVKLNDTHSDILEVSCGVPQGTVLGPLLFIIFINDLLKINTNLNTEIISYADDTAILLSERTTESLYYEANRILNNIYTWFCKNKLKLNLLKSKYILFNPQKYNTLNTNKLIVHSLKCVSVFSNTCKSKCVILENVKELKYLGLILDSRFKWDSHINYLNNILRKFFFIFKEVKYIFNNSYKRIIYLSLVQSVFTYGISIWGGTYNNHLSRLLTTINCIIKYLLNLSFQTSTTLIYKELKIKDFRHIFNFNTLVVLYKNKNVIMSFDHDHYTRYKHNINICLPNYTKVFGQMSVLYKGLKLCQTLNINISHFNNLKSFKKYVNNLDLSII